MLPFASSFAMTVYTLLSRSSLPLSCEFLDVQQNTAGSNPRHNMLANRLVQKRNWGNGLLPFLGIQSSAA